MNITEFLEARISEDEEAINYAPKNSDPYDAAYIPLSDSLLTRLMRECAAKRAIMEVHHPHDHGGEHGDAVFCDECQWDHAGESPRIDNQPVEGFGEHPCRTLTLLAAIYSDHPDYRQEWAI